MSVGHPLFQESNSRSRILMAARTLFAERGSESVTMTEVADAASVSRGTVFNQFGSKRALVEAITEGVLAAYVEMLDKALAATEVPVPVLIRQLFLVMGAGIEADREFYRAVFREITRVMVGLDEGGVGERARIAGVERLVHLVTRGQARDELTRDAAAQDQANALDSLVFGTITHWLYDDVGEPLSARMLRAANLLLDSIATQSGRATFPGTPPDLSGPSAERYSTTS